MLRKTLDELNTARKDKQAVVLITHLEGDKQYLFYGQKKNNQQGVLPQDLIDLAGKALRDDRSQTCEINGERIFLQVFNTPLRLIIIGAVHIAQVLVPLACMSDYEVMVVDPRRAFATDARFPDVRVLTDWPDVAVGQLAPDARTAVVTLTHDPKLDDPALEVALRSPAFYIGSLGSRKTQAGRLARLVKKGFTETEQSRIHGPIGLDIGAKSPAEIAISIMSEITQCLRQDRDSV